MQRTSLLSPLIWPVFSFLLAILVGASLLRLPFCQTEGTVSFLDCAFLATSAVCVTGLASVDIATQLSQSGHIVILLLMQVGGLGITTYTSLMFIALNKRIPLNDRLALAQGLDKEKVDVKVVIMQVIALALSIQLCAALGLYWHDPVRFQPFSAFFHATSAFCNAGFALFSDNLISAQHDPVVNTIIAANIILGGIGFAILREGVHYVHRLLQGQPVALSRITRMIIRTNLLLIVAGGGLIWLVEFFRPGNEESVGEGATLGLIAFFQAISARTAGFNTISMPALSEASLFILIVLMVIGGSSGSCAGGLRTGTFRVLTSYVSAQFTGERQVLLCNRAVPQGLVSDALRLFFLYFMMIGLTVFALSLTENIFFVPQGRAEVPFFNLLFETVSALGTVGLSMDLTPLLSAPGKVLIMLNMFAGRVGFFALLLAVQSIHTRRPYDYAETSLPIG